MKGTIIDELSLLGKDEVKFDKISNILNRYVLKSNNKVASKMIIKFLEYYREDNKKNFNKTSKDLKLTCTLVNNTTVEIEYTDCDNVVVKICISTDEDEIKVASIHSMML